MINKILSRRIYTEVLHTRFKFQDLHYLYTTRIQFIENHYSDIGKYIFNPVEWSNKKYKKESIIYDELFKTSYKVVVITLRDFLNYNGQNYYFEREFIDSLAQANDNIPLSNIPEKWAGYFVVPKGYFYETTNNTKYDGLLISINTKNETKNIRKIILIFTTDYDNNGNCKLCTHSFEIDCNKTLKENVDLFKNENVDPTKHLDTHMLDMFLKPILNMIFYINCSDIECDYLPSKFNAKSNEIKKMEESINRGNELEEVWNKTLVPIIHVFPSFKKYTREMMEMERKYLVDHTFVCGHMRFYRVGKGKLDIVYKWRKGHIRQFKNNPAQEEILPSF